MYRVEIRLRQELPALYHYPVNLVLFGLKVAQSVSSVFVAFLGCISILAALHLSPGT